MLVTPLSLVAQLRALESGKAERVSARRMVLVQPHATMLALLRIAGDEATPHAIVCVRPGQLPRVIAVGEPRNRGNFAVLIHRALGWLPRYLEDVHTDPDSGFPQLIVPSEAAARALELLAHRLVATQGNAHLRRIGRALSYFTQRRHEPGQLALLTATGVIAAHWVTGQDPASDQHLAAAVTWLDPPAGESILDAVADAEMEVMGVNTDPAFDKTVLADLLAYYQEVRASGGSTGELRAAGWHIRNVLAPLLERQLSRTRQAFACLDRAALPPHPELAMMARLEREEFDYFMAGQERGLPVTRTDRPKAAAIRLTARMTAHEQVTAALQQSEPVARAEAVLAGRIIQGVVLNPRRLHLGPRQFSYLFDVRTDQLLVRGRVGDILIDVLQPGRRVRIVAIRRTPTGTVLEFAMTKGVRAVGLPADGEAIELAESTPEWGEIARHRRHASTVLATLPITHTGGPRVGRAPVPPPADILAHLEALR